MACKSPLTAWRQHGNNKLSFNVSSPDIYGEPIKVPCGRCIGCRLEKSRQWAIRISHEASLHPDNCFITLTYNDEHLPSNLSLNLKHQQDFFKRLRKKHGKLRFFCAGEYGSKFGRPHYHAAVLGFAFRDLKLFKLLHGGHRLYTSEDLQSLWPYGFTSVAGLTFESAAYIARYCTKKITGDLSDEHYSYIDFITGEYVTRIPEYATMSRNPGLAHQWYDRYGSAVRSTDSVILKGREMMPPRYYDYLYDLEDHKGFLDLKYQREEKRYLLPPKTPELLQQELQVLQSKNTLLIRKLEETL